MRIRAREPPPPLSMEAALGIHGAPPPPAPPPP
eukprot:SAG31_NODE_32784_length_351_cov_1.496032_1_plen_32_part_10